MHRLLIRRALLLVTFILVLHLFAYKFYFYASISWYDMVMHALGGVFVALLVGATFARRLQHHSSVTLFVNVILAVFAIGLAWEVFEYVVQHVIRNVSIANVPDSLSDLLFDLIGGIVGTVFVIRAARRYNSIHEPEKVA